MARFLPILPDTLAIVDKAGIATAVFQKWWQQMIDSLTNKLSVFGQPPGIVVSDGTANGLTTSFAAGTGLNIANGDGQAGAPTYSLADTAVTPGTYGDAANVSRVTLDQQGRATAASQVSIAIAPTQAGLGNVSNKKQLPVDGSDAMTGPLVMASYTVAGLPAVGAAKVAYASNGRKNGEGPGAGTGVLVFSDATAWRACDTGATVAA